MLLRPTLRKATELGFALTAVATLILAGCGGGGSSTTTGGSNSTPAATTSASITPFKGPFYSGATVTLKDANGNPVTLTSGGTINANGVASVTYNANVTYPLIVEVTGSYYNEITKATESTTVPIRSLIQNATEAAAGVPVTIVTETAVADLETRLGSFAASHPIQAASAVAALSAAGTMLGVPASAVPAFNPTTNQTSDANTLRLAAWAIAANGQTGATLAEKVKALANGLVNPANTPSTLISQTAYNQALASVTSGASSVLAAGASVPAPHTIPTTNYASLYASAGGNNSGGGTGTLTCVTSLFTPGSVQTPSSGELAAHAATYTGSEGTFDTNPPYLLIASGAANLVFNADGTATYNGTALAPTSYCTDSGGGLYIHTSNSHFDLWPGTNQWNGVTPSGLMVNNTPYTASPATGLVVSTLAGSAGTLGGSTDGTGSAAQFKFPDGITVDAAGNLYVADSINSTIRKVTPQGVVSTLAGSAGTNGSADGTGSAARFKYPEGITVDAAGNLYVADPYNTTIRKITPQGVVSTLAGSAGASGSADGIGSAAQFNHPTGITVDAAGNLYVTDSSANTIRKITPQGVVSTLAGTAGTLGGSTDGTGSAAQFKFPTGITVDAAGKLYVTDNKNHTIRKIQ